MKISVVAPLWQDRAPAENMEVALNADRLGYEEFWIGEMATFDAFAFACAMALRTQRIEPAIGPLAVSVRTPMTMAMGLASVIALSGRRARLALGTSSSVVVEEWHGRPRVRTAQQLRDTARIVRGLLDGEKVEHAGAMASCRGYRLRLDAPGTDLTIAAFGREAVKVAAEEGDRLLLNLVTPASVARIRCELEQAAQACGRATPRVALWLVSALDPGRDSLAQALRAMVGYLAAPGYAEMFVEAGFADIVALARSRPHPRELLAAMRPELVDAVCLMGDEAHLRERLQSYRESGVDEICLVPATADDPGGRRTLQALRPQ